MGHERTLDPQHSQKLPEVRAPGCEIKYNDPPTYPLAERGNAQDSKFYFIYYSTVYHSASFFESCGRKSGGRRTQSREMRKRFRAAVFREMQRGNWVCACVLSRSCKLISWLVCVEESHVYCRDGFFSVAAFIIAFAISHLEWIWFVDWKVDILTFSFLSVRRKQKARNMAIHFYFICLLRSVAFYNIL